ncbi:MAG: molybdenum cofactor guanylyltransferase [Clostridiales bacterium]|nr:molybdenum cofactor guanylyltransferase [Clostridiales bacterium]
MGKHNFFHDLDTVSLAGVAGCVLAGGMSRRMGTDKALLELDGRLLIEIAMDGFCGFPEVFVSAGDAEGCGRYAFTSVRVIPDERPSLGPLGGIVSALKASERMFVCFRPVDAPLVPAALHRLMARACSAIPTESSPIPTKNNATTVGATPAVGRPPTLDTAPTLDTTHAPAPYDAAVPTFHGSTEPLLACFSKSAIPVLEGLAEKNALKVTDAFPLLNTTYVPLDAPEHISTLGDPATYLANANDPQTLSKLTALI